MHPDLPVSGDAEHQVSIALVRLLRLRNGRLWHNPLVDPLLRAALLIDRALSGRLVQHDAELELDTSPSGNPAADALLARIAAEPERPLTSWLGGEQPTLAELVELGMLSDGASAAENDVVYQAGDLTWLLVAVRDFGYERLRRMEFTSQLGFGSTGV